MLSENDVINTLPESEVSDDAHVELEALVPGEPASFCAEIRKRIEEGRVNSDDCSHLIDLAAKNESPRYVQGCRNLLDAGKMDTETLMDLINTVETAILEDVANAEHLATTQVHIGSTGLLSDEVMENLFAHVSGVGLTSKKEMVMAATPSQDDIVALAHKLQKPEDTTPLELLQAGLVAVMMDPILLNIRSKEMVGELMAQAGKGVNIITSLAAHLGVKFFGEEVVPSTNYVTWDSDKLKKLAALILADIDATIEKGRAGRAVGDRALNEANGVREQAKSAQARIVELQSQLEAARVQARDQALAINTLVTSYVDMGQYVVAQVDGITGKPMRFARIDTDEEDNRRLRSADTLGKATKFVEWEEANDVRVSLERARRADGKGGRLGVISESDKPRLVVMEISLRPVGVEDFGE